VKRTLYRVAAAVGGQVQACVVVVVVVVGVEWMWEEQVHADEEVVVEQGEEQLYVKIEGSIVNVEEVVISGWCCMVKIGFLFDRNVGVVWVEVLLGWKCICWLDSLRPQRLPL
jgi:hypothetical protein